MKMLQLMVILREDDAGNVEWLCYNPKALQGTFTAQDILQVVDKLAGYQSK